ncbi:MAG: tRNA (adenosine(37)-N6)-threonylcarbamoyltransferase complex transferase subunit TsaD [Candidatus Jorgensenbacteria bacterium]
MRILAIETSCDETGIALLEASGGLKAPKFKIIKNLVSSQIKIHRPFGGVVPNLAKREHLKNLPILFKKLQPKTRSIKADLVAVTVGPGLEPALWTGVNFAKEIRKNLFSKTKLIGANHLEGHLYSFLLSENYKLKTKNLFPAIHLLVSGGHTILVLMKSLTEWRKIGETRDDAVGEAFDKVARMLGLSYPGGPELEKLALRQRTGKPSIEFPRPMINSNNYDFSFSGLKTSVLYYLRDHKEADKVNVAASFQKAAIDVLVSKTARATREFGARSIMLSGGVAANKALRRELKAASSGLKADFFAAAKKFNTDNAAIIAVAGYIQSLRKKNRTIRAQANLNL